MVNVTYNPFKRLARVETRAASSFILFPKKWNSVIHLIFLFVALAFSWILFSSRRPSDYLESFAIFPSPAASPTFEAPAKEQKELLRGGSRFQASAEERKELRGSLFPSSASKEHNAAAFNMDHSPKLGTIKCEKHLGLSKSIENEMVYWRDIPEDRKYRSPYRDEDTGQRKYLSVEVDEGGWNNVRMTIEIAMALAHATGRTFILPPRQGMYLLKKSYSLHDFYDFDGMDVIEMQDFLKKEIMTGSIHDRKGRRAFPPNNRTDWTVEKKNGARELDYFMRTIGKSPKFRPIDKLIFVPERRTEGNDLVKWQKLADKLWYDNDFLRKSGNKYFGKPTPVNASAEDRFEEQFQDRDVWLYDRKLDSYPLIHFMAEDKDRIRMHGLFYYALFFEDWRMDLIIKRYVRDRLRYRDDLFCAAGYIVKRLRQISGDDGKFYTYHVRRNDFAWINLIDSAHDIYWSSHELVPANATVYVATDETDKDWFNPLKERFQVYFLDDFTNSEELKGMNPNFYGIIDQIVASRGTVFIGAFYSTLTMHVNHLRGYYSQKEKSPGYEQGILDSYHYTLDQKEFYRHYRPFWGADPWDAAFPIAWRDIDQGIEK